MNRLRQVKRARHTVVVAVYSARVDLGFPVLFAGGGDRRLRVLGAAPIFVARKDAHVTPSRGVILNR